MSEHREVETVPVFRGSHRWWFVKFDFSAHETYYIHIIIYPIKFLTHTDITVSQTFVLLATTHKLYQDTFVIIYVFGKVN